MVSINSIRKLVQRIQDNSDAVEDSAVVRARKKARLVDQDDQVDLEAHKKDMKDCSEAIQYLLGRLDQAEADKTETAKRHWAQLKDLIDDVKSSKIVNGPTKGDEGSSPAPKAPEPPQLAILRSADITSDEFEEAWNAFQPEILKWYKTVMDADQDSATNQTSISLVHTLPHEPTTVELGELAAISNQIEDAESIALDTPYRLTVVGSSEKTSTTTVLIDIKSGKWSTTSTVTCLAKLQLNSPSTTTVLPSSLIDISLVSVPSRGSLNGTQVSSVAELQTSKLPDCKVTAGYLRTCVGTRQERQVAFAILWNEKVVKVYDTMGDWTEEAVGRVFAPALAGYGSEDISARYLVADGTTCNSHEDSGPAVVRIIAAIASGSTDVALGNFTRLQSFGLFKDVLNYIREELSLSEKIVKKIRIG